MWMEEHLGERVNHNRVDEASDADATTIATGCPFCRVMLTDGVGDRGKAEQVEVVGVAQLLLGSLDPGAFTLPKKGTAADSPPPPLHDKAGWHLSWLLPALAPEPGRGCSAPAAPAAPAKGLNRRRGQVVLARRRPRPPRREEAAPAATTAETPTATAPAAPVKGLRPPRALSVPALKKTAPAAAAPLPPPRRR